MHFAEHGGAVSLRPIVRPDADDSCCHGLPLSPRALPRRPRPDRELPAHWDMATAAESRVRSISDRHSMEHLFFAGMSVLIAVIVFVGFARTYYLAAWFGAKPLAAAIVHIHAAAFTAWLVLFVIQTALVSSGHASLHRQLGLVGLGLAPLMVILGILVAHEMLVRFGPITSVDSPTIFAV